MVLGQMNERPEIKKFKNITGMVPIKKLPLCLWRVSFIDHWFKMFMFIYFYFFGCDYKKNGVTLFIFAGCFYSFKKG